MNLLLPDETDADFLVFLPNLLAWGMLLMAGALAVVVDGKLSVKGVSRFARNGGEVEFSDASQTCRIESRRSISRVLHDIGPVYHVRNARVEGHPLDRPDPERDAATRYLSPPAFSTVRLLATFGSFAFAREVP